MTPPAALAWRTSRTRPGRRPDYYRLLPREVGRALLDGMLGADHVGFHAEWWAAAFLDCCEAILGADVSRARLGGRGRAGRPPRARHRGGRAPARGGRPRAARPRQRPTTCRRYVAALNQVARGRKLIVRVDRTELSKNIVRGLAAYRELLATRPEWHGRVLHLAFAYPSRSAIPEYRAYTEQVQADRAGDRRGVPHAGLESADPRGEGRLPAVAGRLRGGRRAAGEPDQGRHEPGGAGRPGAVASAAARWCCPARRAPPRPSATSALLVNPYDVSETAAALHQALAMPDAERRAPQRRAGRHRRRQAPRPLARGPAGLAGTMTCRARGLTARRSPGGAASSSHRRSRPAAPRSRPAPARPGRPRLRPAGTRRWRWPRHSRGCRGRA